MGKKSTAKKLIEEQQPPAEELSMFRDITTSIIIPCVLDSQALIEMTMKCLQHIGQTVDRQTTEVILIDNGSKMPAYFRTDVHVKNPGNIGYGPAINQGIKLARGRYIVPMNNDCFVQDGWLKPLIDAVEGDKSIGVVRPCQVGNSAYGTEKRKFGDAAVEYGQKDYHGFCYLMPRLVLDLLKEENGRPDFDQYFDEQFRPGYCEDMDMWVRLTKAGYKMAKATDSKVEHLGGITASALSQNNEQVFNDVLNTNRKRFFDKHGFDVFSEDWYSNWQALRQKFGEVS